MALDESAVCAVTLMRGGIHLAHTALRESLRSISVGHILIDGGSSAQDPSAMYAKLQGDIKDKQVLLVDFCIVSGMELIAAVNVLVGHGCIEESIVVVVPIACETGLLQIRAAFPGLCIHIGVVHKEWHDDFDVKRLES